MVENYIKERKEVRHIEGGGDKKVRKTEEERKGKREEERWKEGKEILCQNYIPICLSGSIATVGARSLEEPAHTPIQGQTRRQTHTHNIQVNEGKSQNKTTWMY